MTYKLGNASEQRLAGVHPKLITCVRYAIERTDMDFSVAEGMRTLERQKKLVAAGASRTLDSYHLDGHAVDLVPYIDGRMQWQPGPCLMVARWMLHASQDLSVRLVWGGVWDRELAGLDPNNLGEEIERYSERFKKKTGRKAFLDMPHFQLVRGQ